MKSITPEPREDPATVGVVRATGVYAELSSARTRNDLYTATRSSYGVSLDEALDGSKDEEASDSEEESLNKADLLRQGIILTTQNNGPLNILIVGETGVGKSSVIELIANIVTGKSIDSYDFNILDRSNEAGGPKNQSQTNEPRLYVLHSSNGVMLRILDTPGLADTRGLVMDDRHKANIAKMIEDHMEYVNGVFVVVNGTIPRLTVSTDYVLSTLSSMFPKSLADNIAFIFTHVPSVLGWSFVKESIPGALVSAPRYLLNNPLALQKSYIEFIQGSREKKKKNGQIFKLQQEVLMAEQETLDTFAEIFDWLDACRRQPTSAILLVYKCKQETESNLTNTIAQMDQAKAKHQKLQEILDRIMKGKADMKTFSKFQGTVKKTTWSLQSTTGHNTLCHAAGCYQNCHLGCTLDYTTEAIRLLACAAIDGKSSDYTWPVLSRALRRFGMVFTWSDPLASVCNCGHTLKNHGHFFAKWVEEQDTSIQIDKEMGVVWESTTNAKEKADLLSTVIQDALDQLDGSIQSYKTNLSKLADRYAQLTLSGSIVAHMEKTANFMEFVCKNLREDGNEEELRNVEESLEAMRRKMGALKKRGDDADSETSGTVVIYRQSGQASGATRGGD